MRHLALVPLSGIPARLFAAWTAQTDMNTINTLIELGYIQQREGHSITLHPMVQEITIADTVPSVTNCQTMLKVIHEQIILHRGADIPYFRLLFETIENIMEQIAKDDIEYYLRFIEDTFAYMDKYSYEKGMRTILTEMAEILADNSIGSANDRALLYDYRAAMKLHYENKPEQALPLEEKALSLLPEINTDTAYLASNIYSNMGVIYHRNNHTELATQYVERAVSILNEHDLPYNIDAIPQVCNYAIFLHSLGETKRGLAALHKCAKAVKENLSETSSDYAAIQEATGNIYLSCGELQKAQKHLQMVLDIYEVIWADQPGLIEQKRQEIQQSYKDSGAVVGKYLANLYRRNK